MADRYTSRIALVLDAPLDDPGAVVQAARESKDLDRASPVPGDRDGAHEVHWGGRMQRAVVRQVREPAGAALLRTEAYLGDDGLVNGMQRQAKLLQGLARHLRDRVLAVRDISGQVDREVAWLHRVAIGAVATDDAIVTRVDGEGTRWIHTHGAARFDVPDLELYGLRADQVDPGVAALAHVHERLLRGGLTAALSLPDGTPVRLVPVRDAWQRVPLDWPGVGRAGQDRGEGLDGPRATLSVLHKRRFGRYRTDLDGVLETLRPR